MRVVIAAPGLGDDIQAMKSGLLEIADVLVVNKGDREGAEQTMHQLKGALSIRAYQRDEVPVLKTTATTGEGIAELLDAVFAVGARVTALPPLERRRRRARYLIARAAADLVSARVKQGAASGLDHFADDVLAGTLSPDEAAQRLMQT